MVVVVVSEQEAASAANSDAVKNTAAGLVLIIHRLAVRATRSRSEQRFFMENKYEVWGHGFSAVNPADLDVVRCF